ncbi:hypothetical protein CC78DRAFT_542590 [Lojkania enalia]|uniref:Uncharacterized protein n=1 Tax=Lojkania enalia TaxID=147567 RepID=A0A9P4KBT2_9PLEO|nr:hypothetical protein CC78DRAFT_542590 [Didymosphaeria enalia]
MGRYETLNPQTKDVVDCLIPGIASNFEVTSVADVIPQDIRMRKWDCDRREHIINESEDDPRNWGVQFLKDLLSISRHLKGQLDVFQADLRAIVETANSGHTWARLSDIKELKEKYEGKKEPLASSSSAEIEGTYFGESSSDDSYLEEIIVTPKKRGRTTYDYGGKSPRHHSTKRCKRPSPLVRLHRSSSMQWERRDKSKRHRQDYWQDHRQDHCSGHYPTPTYNSGYPSAVFEEFGSYPHPTFLNPEYGSPTGDLNQGMSAPEFPTPSISTASYQYPSQGPPSIPPVKDGDIEKLSIYELQLQLEVAEAELKASKIRLALIDKKRAAASGMDVDSSGTKDEPCMLDG